MQAENLVVQIKGLELQLAVLKARARQLSAPVPCKSAKELYGLLAGQMDLTEEDIAAFKYRVEWHTQEENRD